MSEYQYYEFQAIDRPLMDSQMKELRTYSSRAQITPTSFVNVYNWGDFKGDRREWMEKYFDAFLYVANWGSHRLEFRVPKRLAGPQTVSEYCTRDRLTCRVKGEYVIVSFASEDESGEWAEGEGWLSSLIPLRADLMNGDNRCLYLGWLVAAQEGFLDDDEIEPPVPPGLGTLTAPLTSLARFLRIAPDIIVAAAEESAEARTVALMDDEVAAWVGRMSPEEKDAVIAALIEGGDPHFTAEFRQRAAREIRSARDSGSNADPKRRSVRQLLVRADSIAEERRKREAEARVREEAKREQERAEARKQRAKSLLGKEDDLWSKVDALIATRLPGRYDEAVSVLQDLSALAHMKEQGCAFSARMEKLSLAHARKPTLLDRLRKANLIH